MIEEQGPNWPEHIPHLEPNYDETIPMEAMETGEHDIVDEGIYKKMTEKFKAGLRAGQVGIRTVWGILNGKNTVVRRKEFVTVTNDTKQLLEVIPGQEKNNPSFVFYLHHPPAFPEEVWLVLRTDDEVLTDEDKENLPHVNMSAKYHDSDQYIRAEVVTNPDPRGTVLSLKKIKERLLDPHETELVEAQTIAAVAKHTLAQELGLPFNSPHNGIAAVINEDIQAVSVPTTESNQWFSISARPILEGAFAIRERAFLNKNLEFINPSSDEALTIVVEDSTPNTPPNERVLIVQQEISAAKSGIKKNKKQFNLARVIVAIGGGVENGESGTRAIYREALEEIRKAGQQKRLGGTIRRSGILKAIGHVFVTLSPSEATEKLQGDELEESIICRYTVGEIKRKIVLGEITDAATIAALFKTIIFLENPPTTFPEMEEVIAA